MRTRHVLVAAAVAGGLGIVASLAVNNRSWLARTPTGQSALLRDDGRTSGVAREGDRVPALTLPDPEGRPTALSPLIAGRPALINVWASWCRPCLEEMPALDAFARQQGPNGMQVVGIALDDPAAVRDFLARRPVAYRILIDTPGPADAGVQLGNPRGVLPYSALVAADGRILRRWVGPLDPSDLDDWARDAAAAPTAN